MSVTWKRASTRTFAMSLNSVPMREVLFLATEAVSERA